MILIKPADEQPYILAFDSAVLEVFAKFRDESHRLYVTQIQSSALNTDKKGKHELEIKSPGRVIHIFRINDEQYAKASEFVSTVQAAMTNF